MPPSNLIPQGQLVHAALTALVHATVPQSADLTAGLELFPPVEVGAYLFIAGETFGEDQVLVDTERPEGADFAEDTFRLGSRPYRLRRFSFSTPLDEDTVTNASAAGNVWPVSTMAAANSKSRVMRDIERRYANLVADTSNYAAVISTAKWNLDGTLKSSIMEAEEVIAATAGVGREEMRLMLFGNALAAAELDPEMNSRPLVPMGTSMDLIREYLGVAQVKRARPTGRLTKESAPTSLYGNRAVLYYPGRPELLASPFGGVCWGKTYRKGQGDALAPEWDQKNRSWHHQFQHRVLPVVENAGCAVLIEDPFGTA